MFLTIKRLYHCFTLSIISKMDIFDRMNIKPINVLTVAEGVSTNLSNLLLLISCAT